MFNEVVFIDVVKVEGVGRVIWVCADSACSENVCSAGAEVYGRFESGDGHFFCDVFAVVGEEVVVCEGVDAGAG